MNHLIVCPEYPPAPIPAGGIGTYARNIARLMAEAGETVHVVSIRWHGAPEPREALCEGRLIVHRLALDGPLDVAWNAARAGAARDEAAHFAARPVSADGFAWQTALFVERLVETEAIDVVEAQEYDAPLYYFQLRRALGLGPARRPPCLVHLHSPTELIMRANEWNPSEPRLLAARRMETFSITSGDAWVCPSRYLARHAEPFYGLPAGAVEVVPLPIGAAPRLERDADVWREGTICYVGRLEPRKGIIEWIEAAIAVAPDFPALRFEFLGADLPYEPGRSVLEHLERTIPKALRRRFVFHGQVARAALADHLRRAKIAVVPSRWENFPNSCVEAMASGLPVLATRQGGMAELVEDGYSGWLTDRPGAAGLERALRRALATPSLDLQTMGRNAVRAIRHVCDDGTILKRHLALRDRVAALAPGKAPIRPVGVMRAGSSIPRLGASEPSEWHGAAIVVAVAGRAAALTECLERLEALERQPRQVVVAIDAPREPEAVALIAAAGASRVVLVTAPQARLADLWSAGIEAASAAGPVSAFVLIDAHDRVRPALLGRLEDAARYAPSVGALSCWIKGPRGLSSPPVTTLPYELLHNEIETPLLVRREALESGVTLHRELGDAHALWDLVVATLGNGWGVATLPELLSERRDERPREPEPLARRMRLAMLESAERIIAEFAVELVELLECGAAAAATARNRGPHSGPEILRPRDILHAPLSQKLRLAGKAVRRPREAFGFLVWHVRAALRRIPARPSAGADREP